MRFNFQNLKSERGKLNRNLSFTFYLILFRSVIENTSNIRIQEIMRVLAILMLIVTVTTFCNEK